MTERGEAVPFRRRWQVWALAAAVAVAGAVFHPFWPMSQTGTRGEPPLIKARQKPLRIKPETPGGMRIPDQERDFFRHLEGRSPPRIERLVPPPPLGSGGRDVSGIPASVPRSPPPGKLPPAREDAPLPERDSLASGSASVQLGALASEGAARRAWTELRRHHGDLLGGLSLTVERVSFGDGGTTLYRMRAGPVKTPGAAKALCAELKARGQDCLAFGR